MKRHIFIFFISILGCCMAFSQDVKQDDTILVSDSIPLKKLQYGLRLGIDLSKPIRSLVDKNYNGVELVGDFRISERYYLAAELGNENRTTALPNINSTSTGSYLKAGINYNAYTNWYGMQNLIYGGARVGLSTFKQTLNEYTIYTTDPLFDDDTRTTDIEFSGSNALWIEFQLGLQTEVLKNVFVGLNFQLKRRITETAPSEFENLYIPGFGRTTDGSDFGTGYGYTVTYFLPLFKKNTKIKQPTD